MHLGRNRSMMDSIDRYRTHMVCRSTAFPLESVGVVGYSERARSEWMYEDYTYSD